MDFGDLSDNPFAVQTGAASRPRRRALASALKMLVLVSVGLSLALIVQSASRGWVVKRLTADFGSLDSGQKQARLAQLADAGPAGIQPIVGAMTDQDIEVARTAYDLLIEEQNQWSVLQSSERQRRHACLVEALESIAVYLPDDRTGWGSRLLQQSLMSSIDRDDRSSRELFDRTQQVLKMLSLSERAGPSILSDDPLDPNEPRRLTVQANPLPVASLAGNSAWTDWPPPPQPDVRGTESETAIVGSSTQPRSSAGGSADAASPTVYRTAAARLQPVQSDDPVILRDVHQGGPRQLAQQTAGDDRSIRSVTHLVDSPMETFDDKSVIHWLASPHRVLRDKARSELVTRGYDETQLSIATQIASGDAKTRIALVDSLARSASVDPRPWLLMMLSDESRDVKLRVISVLATMDDPSVESKLRNQLVGERDPTVAARIRRVLDLR